MEEVYEIHLLDFEWSSRHLKYLEAVQGLPWGVLWTTRTIEVGTFCSFVKVSLTIFIHHFVNKPLVWCMYCDEKWVF